jgi:hypothetical protein
LVGDRLLPDVGDDRGAVVPGVEEALGFVLERRSVPDCGVDPAGVEPGDVLEDRKFQLAVGAPDAVLDQLGLERVDEALSHRVDAPLFVNYRFRVIPKGSSTLRVGSVRSG